MERTKLRSFQRAEQRSSIWPFLNRILLMLILMVSGALVYLMYYPENARLEDLRNKVQKLREQEKQVELENRLLQREIHLLQTDPEYLELIARDKLDLMKPGETIFRLDSRPDSSSSFYPVR
ncbi:MAG: septum formation initiator family protein [Chthoniobacterales bacterium]|nr:septum formation initiator family protein [Chthoniobacterales bacterium]